MGDVGVGGMAFVQGQIVGGEAKAKLNESEDILPVKKQTYLGPVNLKDSGISKNKASTSTWDVCFWGSDAGVISHTARENFERMLGSTKSMFGTNPVNKIERSF